ncbi:MAG: BREX-1 system adenine-specific DNA-methyltransferase PglX [Desulfobacterales bacterium]|nr:BREX-1 system adenine-specific DNA-methyltransferase PglX [Desulfobacterales bacterium]MDD4071285.1 BREX-1 system adenine-specific DNA-methyltransferase PglX [Desulfobacterales bacterium]MDD4393322.1 BREX-1 system adenine-specific DNA-methyltransferase PglX [Desulfobacterales bacterium]
MKLSDHVNKLRNLIEGAFDKRFARLGIGKTKKIDPEKLSAALKPKRQRFECMLENHVGETGGYDSAREKLIDELTFTLFNRIAAIKVMEAASLFPPIITKQPEHGDRSFGHKVWLEIRPDMRSEELEGIREYIKHAFNELGKSLPLYGKSYPYALLPDVISLNEIIDAFNDVEKDPQVGADIWQSDDVLGWLYESYNNAKKQAFKASKAKTEYDKVSLQSQVYTPRWVVQFLVDNSLGKLYLEMYPDSEIKHRYKIANAPKIQERKPEPLHEIRLIDPACGSGNFLLYAFDLFYELYLDQIENYGADYDEDDIPGLIIGNNLHGIDLDDRAIQLAQLGLYIKARKKRRSIGRLTFKVVSSDFFLPDYEEVRHIFEEGNNLDRNQKRLITDIWSDLQYAYKFGSLIRLDEKLKSKLRILIEQREPEQQTLFSDKELRIVPKPAQLDLFTGFSDIEKEQKFIETFFKNLKTAVEQYARSGGNNFLASKTRDAITFLELLTTEYDVATANPPYTDSSDFGPKLKIFIEDNYKKPYKFHTNLYATFIKRCYEFTGEDGKIAMIHPHTFMFIKSFEGVRKFMIEKTHIDAMVDFGLDRVNLFGPGLLLDATFYVLSKLNSEQDGSYFNLTTNLQEKYKKGKFLEALDDFVSGKENERVYTLPQSKLKIIKSWPFIYWISDEFREKFGEKGFGEYVNAGGGLTSANNDRFLRFWWEVSMDTISKVVDDAKKWKLYVKGGPFNKWYGNVWTIVNWGNNGHEIRTFCDIDGKRRATLRCEKFYFKEGMTYAKSGSKGASFRYMPSNTIIDSGSPGIYVGEYTNLNYGIAFLNSTLTVYILGCLNPTVSTQVGDVERVPFVIPPENIENIVAELANACINVKKYLCTFFIIEPIYSGSAIEYFSRPDLKIRLKSFINYENQLLTQVLINEAIINEKIFEVYGLTEHDKAMVLAKEGESIGGLPVSVDAREAYLAEEDATKEFPLDTIRNFIESLPVKEFTAEERESIESEFPSLYQSNNDLEEFCIRHQVNPINVWYWFKQSNVIPKQRMHTLAMEFLADMIREILMEDDDGIIPLVPNAGEKVLLDRIEEKFREKGFTMAQYSSFDNVMGRPLNEYVNKYFFAELSDHLNLFMYLPKTPFIWHLSSGPEQGFDCYIIIYKWSRDKLMRLRSVYIEHRERALINRQSDLAGNESADAQNEKDRIFRQLKELEAFKVKIDELLAEGYDPILDDGVGKNIAPLQKKKMIPYEVLNAGQLKKYLNADW